MFQDFPRFLKLVGSEYFQWGWEVVPVTLLALRVLGDPAVTLTCVVEASSMLACPLLTGDAKIASSQHPV